MNGPCTPLYGVPYFALRPTVVVLTLQTETLTRSLSHVVCQLYHAQITRLHFHMVRVARTIAPTSGHWVARR